MIHETLLLNKQELKTIQQAVESLRHNLQKDIEQQSPVIKRMLEQSIEFQSKLLAYVDAKIADIERCE